MKREILFKAKRVDNNTSLGDWVYGSLLVDTNKSFIVSKTMPMLNDNLRTEVIPETVCQYTGLKDINGNKIFEGDKFDGTEEEEDHIEIVWSDYSKRFQADSMGYDVYLGEGSEELVCGELSSIESYGLEELDLTTMQITGNIHD